MARGVSNRTTVYSIEASSPDRIDTRVTVISVDPFKNSLVARVEFIPQGNLTSDDGKTANQDLMLNVNSITGGQERSFPKGKRINPIEVTLEMFEGDIAFYPFDRYTAGLDMDITTVPAAKTPSSGTVGATSTSLPLKVDFLGSLHGLVINSSVATPQKGGGDYLEIYTSRSNSALFFALFVQFLMILLGGVVAWVIYSILFRGRKPEVSMFSWLGALLFALPAVRNSMPGAPPIGSITDVVVFFWAEILVALCLVTIIVTWLVRPAK